MITIKRAGLVAVTTVSVIAAMVGGVVLGAEYQSQKEDLEFLELQAQGLTGDTDFYGSEVTFETLHITFPSNEVFDTPEWLAYDVLAENQDNAYKASSLDYLRETSEAITFPGLKGKASNIYESVEENIDESVSSHQESLLYEASSLAKKSETKEEALALASEWDFAPILIDSSYEGYDIEARNSELLTSWGLEDPSDENIDIAREGIRKAITVAVDEHYDVLKNTL